MARFLNFPLPEFFHSFRGQGGKKLKYSPSPFPLPRGERVNILKYKKKFPPPRRGRARVGVEMRFFYTFGEGEGGGDFRQFFTPSWNGGISAEALFQGKMLKNMPAFFEKLKSFFAISTTGGLNGPQRVF